MKKLIRMFTLAVMVSFIASACTSDDDFNDVVQSSDLDQSGWATDAEDDEVAKPGSNS